MPTQATAREHAGLAGHRESGVPAESAQKAVDPADYRRVLGHFPSGVTVVTAEDADGPVGFACQAFSALSLDPPLVLFSVGLTSTTWPRIKAVGRFCVNFLAADHASLCRAFAVSGGDKFDGVTWRRSELGSPILDGAHGWVDCTIEATYPGGDHTIVVGRVHGLDADEESSPLIFHRGEFG
ncbi:MAG: flavin reductase family protein [Catenulispora sp.]